MWITHLADKFNLEVAFDDPEGVLLRGDWVMNVRAFEQNGFLNVQEIEIIPKGNGYGTTVVEELRAYSAAHDLKLCFSEVTNTAFFDRFEWLESDGFHGEETGGATYWAS